MRLLLLQRKRMLQLPRMVRRTHRRSRYNLRLLLLLHPWIQRNLDVLALLKLDMPMQPSISVVIKPTLECGIDCRHCYHRPGEKIPGNISDDNLDRLFRLVSQEYEQAWFIWHGGEPLTLPLQFYKRAVGLQEKYFGKDSGRVGNTIQTNGLGIDRKFAVFCRDSKINIGVSYEGPCNDVLRQRSSEVGRNLSYLSKKEHVFSVNSTISAETVERQTEIYEHFRDRGINVSLSKVIPSGCAADNLQLIPDADAFIKGSIEAFDRWLTDTDSRIPLVPHYLYLLNAFGETVQSDCAHSSCLTKWLCMNPDGDLYPCAKNCPTEFRMCNISEIERISSAFSTEGFRRILAGTVARREKCKGCEIFQYCNGGCSIDALCEGDIENNGGDSCRIYKAVFSHVKEVADGIIRDRPDLRNYNKFVRDAAVGKLVNPMVFR